jgi:DNA polymerase-3 subunit gamma/tau
MSAGAAGSGGGAAPLQGRHRRAPGAAAAILALALVAVACAKRAQPTAPAGTDAPPPAAATAADAAASAVPPAATPAVAPSPAQPPASAAAGSPLAEPSPAGAAGAPAPRPALALRTPPLDGVAVAAVRFLAGAARLQAATGGEAGAARASRLMAEVQARAEPTDEQLTELGVIAEGVAETAHDTARLDRTPVGAVQQAAVEVGVATVLMRRAVDAAREARNWPLIVSSEGPRARRLLASPAPASLQAMETVQVRLFRYLGRRGIDPLPSVRAALGEL